MRVCYFGTYRAGYSRNQIMQEGLRRAGIDVVVCHAPLWTGIEDRVQVASGGWARPSFLGRLLRATSRLLRQHRRVGEYDAMVLGYPGQLDTLVARRLTRHRRKPLVLDIFMSIYLIAEERGLAARHPLTGRLLRALEEQACRLPDRLILDTRSYVAWFEQAYQIPASRFRLVPTGADDRVFRPVPPPPRSDGCFRVLYYGTFIRNHGVEQIVQAAALLAAEPAIQFEMIGTGPERPRAEALAAELGLGNVRFVDWLDKEELPIRAAAAEVCLGAFGQTEQSLRTVQNKIYEGLAMRRPVLTGDSAAVRAEMEHGRHLYLVPRGEPEALAEAILTLRRDGELRERLAGEGHELYLRRFTPTALGALMRGHLEELLAASPPHRPGAGVRESR